MSKPLLLIRTLLVFLCLWSSLAGQNSLDSLMQVEAQMADDTSRVHTRLLIAQQTLFTQPEIALEYGQGALDLSIELGDEVWRGTANNLVGLVYFLRTDYVKAVGLFEEAKVYYEILGNALGMATVDNNLGTIYTEIEDYDAAERSFQAALDYFEEQGETTQALRPAINLGLVMMEKGQLEEALAHFQKLLKDVRKVKDPISEGSVLVNIGDLLHTMGRYDEALKSFKEAEAVAEKSQSRFTMGNVYHGLTESYLAMGQYKLAMQAGYQSLTLNGELEAGKPLAGTHGFMADIHHRLGNSDSAFYHLRKSVRMSDSLELAKVNERMAFITQRYETKALENKMALMEKSREVDSTALKLAKEEAAAKDAKLEKQKVTTIAMTVGLLLALVLSIGALRMSWLRKRNQERLEEMNSMIVDQKASIESQNKVLQDQNEKLEDLLREKDGLVHILAHDLKAPLTRTGGLLNVLQGTELDENQQRVVDMISKVTSEGEALIRDLLDLNAVEQPGDRLDIQPHSLGAVLASMAETYQAAAAQKDLRLLISLNSGGHALVDRNYLNRILDNLISNALKFSPQGKRIWLHAVEKDGWKGVEVRDEGPGIAKEEQDKLFKKFQRLSARPTGGESSTGLGLAIVKTLCEKMNGEIEVKSEPGKGTAFTVWFPEG